MDALGKHLLACRAVPLLVLVAGDLALDKQLCELSALRLALERHQAEASKRQIPSSAHLCSCYRGAGQTKRQRAQASAGADVVFKIWSRRPDSNRRPAVYKSGFKSRSIRLADLLAQSDDDAFRPTDVAKPIGVLVLHYFAYQLGPVGEQAPDDSVDVFDGEHDATDAQRVHRRVHGPKPDRVGRVELVEFDATVSVRGPHEREGGANVLEPDQAVDRRSLDLRLAFELEAEFDEERLGRLEVVDNDENVVHPLNRHVLTLVPRKCGRVCSGERLRWAVEHRV